MVDLMEIYEVGVSALIIMMLRICDVTLGTFRTIQVVNAKKYQAGLVGFVEVLIWIFAMRYIIQHLDNTFNLIGYAAGFGIGNILGVTLEQKIGLGFIQVSIISKFNTDSIVDALRKSRYGTTILPGEGGAGGVSIIFTIIRRRHLKELRKIVESIDTDVFINVQPASPFRGYIHGVRK